MLPDEFNHLKLIPASDLRGGVERIPPDPGVYLWFVRGGRTLLEHSSYFSTHVGHLLSVRGHEHLYTGAAYNLRVRVSQHVRNPCHENSSPKKSLVALERRFGSVSKAVESEHDIETVEGLSEWIFENVIFGIEVNPDPFGREASILHRYASPFNIALRRNHRYSKWLMQWRADAFPPDWLRQIPSRDRRQTVRGAAVTRRLGSQRSPVVRKRTPEEYRELMRLRGG